MKSEYTKPYDPIMTRLKNLIVSKHQLPEYTRKELIKNAHVKDFCCMDRHFAMLGNIPISYETESWLLKGHAKISISKIILYESLSEYEKDRSEIYKSKESDIPNLN